MTDSYAGDNEHLCVSIDSLLALDAAGNLVPHGVGGAARQLLASAAARLRARNDGTTPMQAVRTERRRGQLNEHRTALLTYLRVKTDAEDWHGVSDAANDLREIDAELKGMRHL